ncbi:hypothetical protein BH23ACT6_BH23ACT6_04380 [soil metagenome]
MSQPDPPGVPVASRGRRDAGVLAAGSLLGGLLAYVFFALVIRALGAGAAAPVTVLWAWWGFAGAALTFPVQHWIARTASTTSGEAAVRRGMGQVAAAVIVVSLTAGGLAWVARERLFGPDGEWFALLVVGVGLGSGLLGLPRGLLSGRHRFASVGASIVTENAVRCLVAAALVLAGSDNPVLYGLALLAGYAVVAVWPSALRPHRAESPAPGNEGLPLSEESSPRSADCDDATGPLRFVSGASAGQLVAQATLTGGPVLLAAIGGAPAQVTVLFAGLALFRAPYTLALGLVSALTGRLTRLVEGGRWARLTRLRRGIVVSTFVLGVAGAGLGAWWGPPVMEIVFGEGVRLAPGDAALVAFGTVVAMANLVLTVGLLARGGAFAVVGGWLIAIPFGVLAHLGLVGDALTSTCWTFVAIEVAAFVALAVTEARSDHLVSREEDRGPEG